MVGEGAGQLVEDTTELPYAFHSGAELLDLCARTGKRIWELMLENEKALASEDEVRRRVIEIWRAMAGCVRRGS